MCHNRDPAGGRCVAGVHAAAVAGSPGDRSHVKGYSTCLPKVPFHLNPTTTTTTTTATTTTATTTTTAAAAAAAATTTTTTTTNPT